MTPNTDPVRALDYTPGRLDETAPERIWLQIDTAGNNADRDLPFPDADGVTWEQDSVGGLEIQYVRADLASAPPSAPVGVEWLRAELSASAAYAGDYIGDERVVLLAVAMRKIDKLAALSQQPAAPTLAKHQPCGCVICTCEDEQQCQGCGAKHCGNRADHPPYVVQQPAAPSGEAVGDWVLVPRVPTDAMLDAMHGRIRILCNPAERTADIQNDVEVWGAMLAAAPRQPAGVDEAALQDIADATAALDKRGDRQMATRMMRLHARLAAQQQGGRADG